MPFGPDKSRGLSDLHNLRVIQLHDSPKPSIDFRVFEKLKRLEVLWENTHPEYFANEHLEELTVQGVGGEDLLWLSGMRHLRALTIKSGKLASLNGLENIPSLRQLNLYDLRQCTDVSAVCLLRELDSLTLDAPGAVLHGIDWISSSPNLKELSLDCRVKDIAWEKLGEHLSLARISLVAEEDPSSANEEVVRLLSAAGRKVLSYSRSSARLPMFSIALG